MMEMYQYDPIEGPSWLLDTRARRRGPNPRLQKTTEAVKPAQSTADSTTDQDDVVSQSTNNLNVTEESSTVAAEPIPETEATANPAANSISSESQNRISEPEPEPVDRESGRPNKRRAAAAAVASLKEPSLHKKLRQGDDLGRDAKFRVTNARKSKSTGAKK